MNCEIQKSQFIGFVIKMEIYYEFTLFPTVKRRVCGIEILGIQMVLDNAQSLAETLEVYYFTFTQVADGVADFRVFYQAENVFIGTSSFLFCCHVFCQVRDGVSFGLEFTGVKGNSPCCLRP